MRLKRLLRKMGPSSNKEKGSLTDLSYFQLDTRHPRFWLTEIGEREFLGSKWDIFNDPDLDDAVHHRWFQGQEWDISCLVSAGRPHDAPSPGQRHVSSVVLSIPDFVDRIGWDWLVTLLARNDLLRHAKIIPHSVALVQYYLHTGLLTSVWPDDAREPSTVVISLCTDEMVVECCPLTLHKASHSSIEIRECPEAFMAEANG